MDCGIQACGRAGLSRFFYFQIVVNYLLRWPADIFPLFLCAAVIIWRAKTLARSACRMIFCDLPGLPG